MGALTDALRVHQLVGIDTSIFIYQFEDSPRYAGLGEESLSAVERGDVAAVTSVLTLMEVTVQPLRLGRQDVADAYVSMIVGFPNLTIVDVDAPASRRAALLRAAHNLRPADALQVAACMQVGATAFLTNDRRLQRIRELDVIMLDDFVDRIANT